MAKNKQFVYQTGATTPEGLRLQIETQRHLKKETVPEGFSIKPPFPPGAKT